MPFASTPVQGSDTGLSALSLKDPTKQDWFSTTLPGILSGGPTFGTDASTAVGGGGGGGGALSSTDLVNALLAASIGSGTGATSLADPFGGAGAYSTVAGASNEGSSFGAPGGVAPSAMSPAGLAASMTSLSSPTVGALGSLLSGSPASALGGLLGNALGLSNFGFSVPGLGNVNPAQMALNTALGLAVPGLATGPYGLMTGLLGAIYGGQVQSEISNLFSGVHPAQSLTPQQAAYLNALESMRVNPALMSRIISNEIALNMPNVAGFPPATSGIMGSVFAPGPHAFSFSINPDGSITAFTGPRQTQTLNTDFTVTYGLTDAPAPGPQADITGVAIGLDAGPAPAVDTGGLAGISMGIDTGTPGAPGDAGDGGAGGPGSGEGGAW